MREDILKNVCMFCKHDPTTCAKKNSEKSISIILNTTDSCNENCSYCWQRKNNIHMPDMTTQDIDALMECLDFYMPDYSKFVLFMGGEPTLRPDIIQYTMTRLLTYPHYYAKIITNGTMDPIQYNELIKDYKNLETIISLPRKTSLNYDLRLFNLEMYVMMQKKYHFAFSSVVSEDTICDLYTDMKFWKAQGINDLFLNYEFDMTQDTIKDYEAYESNLVQQLKLIRDNLNDKHFSVLNVQNIKTPPTRKLIFNPDSFTVDYYSDRNFYISHFSKTIPIGNTKDGFNMGVLKNLHESSPCYTCEYNVICGLQTQNFLVGNHFVKNKSFCFPKIVTYKFNSGGYDYETNQ